MIHFKGKPAISYLEKSSDPKVEILKPPPVKLTMKDELALRVKARQEKLEKISDVSSNPSESHIPSHLSSNPSFVHLQSPALETSFQTPSSVKPDLPQKLETKQDKTDFSDSGSDFSSQQSLVIEVPRPRGMTFEEELKSRLKKKFGK